uniref:Macroglobulin domain-containing protein n=1 Tax=Eptatretus burgeri TaxID=7764 RepID=A0A8C4R1P9_EPTBU
MFLFAVLPKFEVIINIPTFIVQNEQRGLAGTAVAKYTYGMKVRGEARVTLSAFVFKPCEPNTECILSKYGQKEVKISNIFPEINGQVDFAFSHREIMKMLQNAFPGRMKVSVEVKEKLTGIVTKAEKSLRFSKERNRLQFVNAPRSFMPGMKYITYVQVTQYDGTPLLPKDRCMAVYVLIKETGAENRASHKNMYLCILDNGIVK